MLLFFRIAVSNSFSIIKFYNVQFFPAIIKDDFSNADEVELAQLKEKDLDFKSKTYDNYHIANIVGIIDCIDHETSELEYFVPRQEIPDDIPEEMKKVLKEKQEDKDIDFIRKLVLDESMIPDDIKIFRLKDCPRILVFKEEIVKAIRVEGLTGFVFIPLEKYTDEIPDDDDEEEEGGKGELEEKRKEGEKEEAQKEEREDTSKPKGKIVIKNIRKND